MNYRSLFICFLICSLSLISCRKSTNIGIDILPSGDDINGTFTDTFRIVTTSLKEDSVLTSSQLNNLLGNMYDPVFGKTYASVFTEFRLPTTDVNFGTSDTLFLDSVVLTMAYAGEYGYEDVPQSFSVFQVTEPMSPKPEAGYFSNKTFSTDPEVLGRARLVVPNLTDSIDALGQSFAPHLRIRLSDRFGQDLLNQSGTVNLTSDTTFKNYLKGLSIVPDTVNTPYAASIIYFNLLSPTSGLHLYWHTPTRDSVTFNFPITVDEVRTNYYKHSYSGSVVEDHLINQTAEGDSLIFIQAMGGISSRITIPNLYSLDDVIINKAELVMTQRLDPNRADSVFKPPTLILAVTKDSAGKYAVLPDELVPFPLYGGTSSKFEIQPGDTVNQYKFNISIQVQQLLDQKITDYGLFIIPYKSNETADRLMAGGSLRDDAWKMKLNLIYSSIK